MTYIGAVAIQGSLGDPAIAARPAVPYPVNMNRIERIFADLRGSGRGGRALMPFLTAGDPDLPTTGRILPAMERAGASICEIGIPFSDPIADGPVIQASMTHALDRGVKVDQVFETIAAARQGLSLGLVAMVSYSIVHRLGPSSFVRKAKQAGFDGFIFPDLPVEESAAIRDVVAAEGMILSMLVAPTTPDERAEQIAQASSGFVYVVSRAGITGEQVELPPELPERLERLRRVTDLPMAVGFGVSNADQVRQVTQVADAAIVGSAVMRRVAQRRDDGGDAVVAELEGFVRDLASGLPQAAGTPA